MKQRKSKEPPPDLGTQREDLEIFLIKMWKENEDILDLPIGPPSCENKDGPAKFDIWENPAAIVTSYPKSKPAIGMGGDTMENARLCPHCGHFIWSQLGTPIGYTVQCYNCRGSFSW